MTFLSPWQWFCSTRTLSNSLETVLTIAALNFWPWALAGDVDGKRNRTVSASQTSTTAEATPLPSVFQTTADIFNLRICLVLAGIACILRPTNLLIWGSLVLISYTRMGLNGNTRATTHDFAILLRESILCGYVFVRNE
jgi:phosphatidylinositol glycan class B